MKYFASILLCLSLFWSGAVAEELILEGQITFQTPAPLAEVVFHGKVTDPHHFVEWRVPTGVVESSHLYSLYYTLGGKKSVSKISILTFINLVGEEGWNFVNYERIGNEFVYQFQPDTSGQKWEYGQLIWSDRRSGLKHWASPEESILGGSQVYFHFGGFPRRDETDLIDLINNQGWEFVGTGLITSFGDRTYFFRRKAQGLSMSAGN